MRRYLTSLFIPLLLLAACGKEEPAEQALDPAGDLQPGTPSFGIYNTLKATGNKVRVAGEISRPFFAVQGHELDVNGASVEVYEFDSRDEADAAAASIASDGTISGQPPLPATPHFHRTDKVIVLYVGDDPSVRSALDLSVGPQFAGR